MLDFAENRPARKQGPGSVGPAEFKGSIGM